MVAPHVLRASERSLSIGWFLAFVTAGVILMLVLTALRLSPPLVVSQTGSAGGLPVLRAHETLVSFEDFSFGAQGWTSTADAGPTPRQAVYGSFAAGAVAKSFELPQGTDEVRLDFDLHLTDKTTRDSLTVRINGQRVIQGGQTVGGANVTMTRLVQTGDVAVTVVIDQPLSTLSLEVAAMPGPNAAWAIDNVSVVAVDRRP